MSAQRWRRAPGALLRRGTVLLMLLAWTGSVWAQAGEPAEQAAIKARVEAIRAWLVKGRPGPGAAAVLATGTTRTVSVYRDAAGALREGDERADVQLTASCKSLEFLARYAGHGGLDKPGHVELDQFVDTVRGLQSRVPGALHRGALANGPDMRDYVTFSNAICGNALLAAHLARPDPAVLKMAVDVGDYLLRLLATVDELAQKQAVLSDHGKQAIGIVDRVTAAGKIQVTSSTWNLAAAGFLHRLAGVTNDKRYRKGAQTILDFQLHGVRDGYDYFAPRVAANDKQLILRWNLGYAAKDGALKHEFADGKWHRHGDIRAPATGTVGTDQIEYALAALFEMGWDREQLKSQYAKYKGMPNAVTCLDSALSFPGYFRIVETDGKVRASAYGNYYDIVGAGILADLKKALFADDYRKALRAMVANEQDWAMTDCNQAPVWSRGRGGDEMSKRSVLVAATSGLALLNALEKK